MKGHAYEEDICIERAYIQKDTHIEWTCTGKTYGQKSMQYIYKKDMHIKETFAQDIYTERYIHKAIYTRKQ